MSTKTWLYVLSFVLTLLFLVTTLLLLRPLIEAGNLDRALTFAGTMATMAAVIIALVSMAMSIHKPYIGIYVGQKRTENGLTWQEIRVINSGDVSGNIAHAFVEIEVAPSDIVAFEGASGLDFQQTKNVNAKQYRYVNPSEPKVIYPGKDIWTNLGFITAPRDMTKRKVNLAVRVVGSQGTARKEFDILVP